MSKWKKIETAPKDGTKILVANKDGEIEVAWYTVIGHSDSLEFVRKAKDGDVYRTVRIEDGYFEVEYAHNPTHWMPLPEPPK